jgi:hypothetical protein
MAPFSECAGRDSKLTEAGRFEVLLDKVPLMPGSYVFTLYAALGGEIGEIADRIRSAGNITVSARRFLQDRPSRTEEILGSRVRATHA